MRKVPVILSFFCVLFIFAFFSSPAFAYNIGNDYPYKDSTPDVPDEWKFYTRECTSFVAWCLNSRNGIYFHNHYVPGTNERLPSNINGGRWGNAYEWEYAASALGYAVDNTPSVGAVALWRYGSRGSWDTTGHVAWVRSVNNDGTIDIEQYTGNDTYVFQSETISASKPNCYLHIADNIAPHSLVAPTVTVSPSGSGVNISWNNVGASSYYYYLYNLDTNVEIPGANIGEARSVYLTPGSGHFRVYVTAYFTSVHYKSSYADFSTNSLKADVDKGLNGVYDLNETVNFSLNGSGFQSYVLKIYRTPTGGQTYLYWEGETYSPQYSMSFPNEGYYSCCFVVLDNGRQIESEWVGWIVQEELSTVSYDANGGTGAPEAQTKRKGVDMTLSDTVPTHADAYTGGCTVSFDASGGEVTPASNLVTFTSTYTFRNWNTSADGTGTSYASGTKYTRDENAVLYAQWNSVMTPQAIILPEPTWEGHVFLGWRADDAAGIPGMPTELLQAGESFVCEQNLTLQAVWRANEYTLTYDANGGSGAPEPQLVSGAETTLSQTVPSRAHYSFLGWASTAETDLAEYQPGDSFSSTEDATLYAVWKRNLEKLFVVPGALTTIGDEAFLGTDADAIYIHDAVVSIGNKAFGDVAIYGYTDSAAEEYAANNGLTFIPVTNDWVLEENVPAGSNIIDEKWTYTRSKTEESRSTNASMDGWTQTGFEWMEMGTWVRTYANYPAGFDTGHNLYSAYEKSALSSFETDTAKRTVSESSIKDYIYWHWTHYWGTSENKLINDHSCEEDGKYYDNFKAYEHSYIEYEPGASYVYWNTGGPEDGSCWWFRFEVLQQTYTDYMKLFYYSRTVTTEETSSSAVEEGGNISNVQHWVKYRF